MAVAMARRVAADMAVMVPPAAGDMVVAATEAVAITLAQRRRGKRLGEDKI